MYEQVIKRKPLPSEIEENRKPLPSEDVWEINKEPFFDNFYGKEYINKNGDIWIDMGKVTTGLIDASTITAK